MARSRKELKGREIKAYTIINTLASRYPVVMLCVIANVSRSGYYKWLKSQQTPSLKSLENEEWKEKIAECHRKVSGIYGYRRVTVWLRKNYDAVINHKRIYRLMRELGLQARIRRKRRFFGRRESVVTSSNRLNRNFVALRPNEKWATDITHIPFNGRALYLSVIYDLFNNEVVSYKLSQRNDLNLVIGTIKAAIKKRDVQGTLLHSDQGFQYTSRQYHQLLNDNNMTASMSRKGNCLDNACMESFFGHFKSECLYLHKFKTEKEVESAIRQYIHFYNKERFQSRLKNYSPVEYRAIVA